MSDIADFNTQPDPNQGKSERKRRRSLAGASHKEVNMRSRMHKMAPLPMVLFASRLQTAKILALSGTFIGFSFWIATEVESVLGGLVAALFFAPLLLVGALIFLHGLRTLFRKRPVLEINHFGVVDHRNGGRIIPWEHFNGSRIRASVPLTHLVLSLRRPMGNDKVCPPWLSSLIELHKGVFCDGRELHVLLTSTDFIAEDVIETVRSFIRFSRVRMSPW
jgi:hypothetical protein